MSQIVEGEVTAVMVTPPESPIEGVRVPQLTMTFAGVDGDRHAGLTMPSNSRTPYYPRGTEIRNARQVSILSAEELTQAAHNLGVPHIEPEWLGANIVIRGIPALSLLPPGTRLFFAGGVTLVVEGENFPCTVAGGAIQDHYPDIAGLTTAFPKAALHLRGLVAWVELPGMMAGGEAVRGEVPDQVLYRA